MKLYLASMIIFLFITQKKQTIITIIENNTKASTIQKRKNNTKANYHC